MDSVILSCNIHDYLEFIFEMECLKKCNFSSFDKKIQSLTVAVSNIMVNVMKN